MTRDTEESVGSLPRRKSLNDWAHDLAAWLFTPLARWLERVGISANAVTLLGFILNLAGGVALAWGYPSQIAAFLIIAGGILDGLDGLLARLSGQVTAFGAFFDSVLDRWSETVVFIGLVIGYLDMGQSVEIVLACVALASSLLVSYTRARAEGVGAQCREGFFTRFERVVVLVAGLMFNLIPLALGVLAVFATFTAIQRIYITWRYLQQHRDTRSG